MENPAEAEKYFTLNAKTGQDVDTDFQVLATNDSLASALLNSRKKEA